MPVIMGDAKRRATLPSRFPRLAAVLRMGVGYGVAAVLDKPTWAKAVALRRGVEALLSRLRSRQSSTSYSTRVIALTGSGSVASKWRVGPAVPVTATRQENR
jgi:hypothetical protein